MQEDADCTFAPETKGQSAVILAASAKSADHMSQTPFEQVPCQRQPAPLMTPLSPTDTRLVIPAGILTMLQPALQQLQLWLTGEPGGRVWACSRQPRDTR